MHGRKRLRADLTRPTPFSLGFVATLGQSDLQLVWQHVQKTLSSNTIELILCTAMGPRLVQAVELRLLRLLRVLRDSRGPNPSREAGMRQGLHTALPHVGFPRLPPPNRAPARSRYTAQA